jgi:hypothetical protein
MTGQRQPDAGFNARFWFPEPHHGFPPSPNEGIAQGTVPEPEPTQELEVKATAQSPRRGWFGGLFGGKR